MIHYHGGPATPNSAAVSLWSRRHALVSFARPDQMALAAEITQSFILDNGAFSLWQSGGGDVDVGAYAAWVGQWSQHPSYDFAIIPDKIDGTEQENDKMIAAWFARRIPDGVPVWHLHESLERLQYLVTCARSRVFPRIALGSSGDYAKIGTPSWWRRMGEAMSVACDEAGRPLVRIHGLRMLSAAVIAHVPLASADSANVARNIGLDERWRGTYQPVTKDQRALILAERIECQPTATCWTRRDDVQQRFELIG